MVTMSAVKNQEDNSESEETKDESVPKEVYVIAQEINIVKSLASHDPIQRSKQLKKLQKWLQIRSNSSFPFSEEDFLRLWKGLYFCMWMCDKPLNQESLAEDLGGLLKCFNNIETSAYFFGAFLKTMSLEWFGLDQWRMDKFMMLVRRMFRAMFREIKNNNWSSESIDSFNSQLSSTVLTKSNTSSIGLTMHVMDVYLDELAKIANGNIETDCVAELVKPFVTYLATQNDGKLLGCIRSRIFYHLLWQSDLGRDYTERFNAWKEMGFPTGSIDAVEKVDEDESSENEIADEDPEDHHNEKERILDPRAGNVDVFIPALPVDSSKIIRNLEEIQYTEVTNTKSRRIIKAILENYKIFESGQFPLGVKEVPTLKAEQPFHELVNKKVEDLNELEDSLYGTTRTLKKLNKKKRRKLLSSLNVDQLNEDNFEDALRNSLFPKKRKSTFSNGWIEEEIGVSKLPSSAADHQNDVEVKTITENATTAATEKRNKGKKMKMTQIENGATALHSGADGDKIEKENNGIIANNENNVIKSITNSDWNETEVQLLTNQNDELSAKQKTSDSAEINSNKTKNVSKKNHKQEGLTQQQQQKLTEWNEPLMEGEVEYFVPSRKIKVKEANNEIMNESVSLVLNPFAKIKNKPKKEVLLGKALKKAASTNNIHNISQKQKIKKTATTTTVVTSTSKKVQIVLQKNTIQKPSDYFKQLISSPQVPYDAEKRPTKGLLKPNLTPSPINPFYMKKIGFKLNESF